MTDHLASKALTILGALAGLLIAAAVALAVHGQDATVVWTLAGTAIGGIGGLLVPREN
jgi:hypothetical protein